MIRKLRSVRRIKFFAVPLLYAALVLAVTVPALAANDSSSATPYSAAPSSAAPTTSAADPIIFLPPGANNRTGPTGDTFSCTSGPPFIFQTNCFLLQAGPPSGLVCDIPTTFTDVNATPVNAGAFECRAATSPPQKQQQKQQPATPITQAPAQTYVSGTNTNNAGSVQTGGT